MASVWRWTLAAWWLLSLWGCSSDDLPLDALTLRDALLSEPQVIASLPAARRQQLAARLERVRSAQRGTDEAAMAPGSAAPEAQLRAVDAARDADGRDALVAALLSAEPGRVSARPAPDASDEEPTTEPLPELEGPAPTSTAADEARALAGRAGRIVRALLRESGAARLERVVAWPCGAAAVGDTVFVNAAWLVAMAALEPADAGAPPVTLASSRPLVLRDNPYNLFATLDACRNDVATRCNNCLSSGACDRAATLRDFRDGRAECEWLADASGADRAAMLCAAGYLSLTNIRDCIRISAGSCDPGRVTNDTASVLRLESFVSTPQCLDALAICLDRHRAPSPTTGPSVAPRTSSCSGPSCSSASCSGPSCSGGGGGCSGGGGGCSGGGGGCSGGGGGCSGGGGGGGCETAPHGRSSPLEGLLTMLAVAAPLLYLAMRGRRR